MSVEEQALQLPRSEKLKLMEALWSDLSRDSKTLESPDWHEGELRKTEERRARGEEELIDWDEAKRRLRMD